MRFIPFKSLSFFLLLASACAGPSEPAETGAKDRWTTPQTNGETYTEAKAWFVKARKRKISQAELWQAIPSRLAGHWYGTEWDFNGTTQVPGEGEIACGYFLTTVLRDAGFKLPRVKLAQLASETMIRRLVQKRYVRRFSNVEYDTFLAKMRAWGDGFYMVGLDNHTGFIQVSGDKVHFIHSTYLRESIAIKEVAEIASVLPDSQYRVVGKLSADKQLYRRWLKGQRVGR